MKLMTYNIYDGAVGTLDNVVKVVKKESPDYLTLNEANTFADNDSEILKKFAKETGFDYFSIALSGEDDYHVAILSKYPFKSVKKLDLFARACLIVLIDTEYGELSIASTHLTPYAEDLRLPEISAIIQEQEKYANRIIMGDLNSLSPQDGYDDKIMNNFNEAQIRKFTKNNELQFNVINKILANGYIDCAVELGKNAEKTVPTPINKDKAHSQMRLDYIFLSQSLLPHLNSYNVVKNEFSDNASDHYPVTVELK